jgi:hypothetical protein
MASLLRKPRASGGPRMPVACTHGSVCSRAVGRRRQRAKFSAKGPRCARRARRFVRAPRRAGRGADHAMTPGSLGGCPGAGGSTIEGEGSPGSVGSRGGSRRGGSREGGSRIGGPEGSGSRRGCGGFGSRTGWGAGVPREGGLGVVMVLRRQAQGACQARCGALAATGRGARRRGRPAGGGEAGEAVSRAGGGGAGTAGERAGGG